MQIRKINDADLHNFCMKNQELKLDSDLQKKMKKWTKIGYEYIWFKIAQ